MKTRIKTLPALAVAAAACVVAVAACTPPGDSAGQSVKRNAEDGKVVIGVVGAFSGPLRYVGDATLAGAQFAVDVANDNGGVLGGDVELVSCDGKFQPSTEKTCLTKLVSNDAVDAIILDDPTLEFVEPKFMAGLEVPVMLPVAAPLTMDPTVYPNSFGLEPLTGSLAVLTEHLKNAGFNRIGVIAADDVFFSTVLDEFKVELEAAGLTPVAVEQYTSGDVDLTAQVRALQAADADAMVILGLGADAARAVKAAGELGYSPQVAGTETLYMSAYRKLGQEATNDTLLTLPNPGDSGNVSTEFLLWLFDYFNRYGVKTISVGDAVAPDYPGLERPAYELTDAVLAAMADVNSTEPSKVEAALERNEFDGVARTIKWDVDSHLGVVDPQSEVWMARFRDGHILFDPDPRAVPALEEARVALEAYVFSQDLEDLDFTFIAELAERYKAELEARRDDIVAQGGQERYDELIERIDQGIALANAVAENPDLIPEQFRPDK